MTQKGRLNVKKSIQIAAMFIISAVIFSSCSDSAEDALYGKGDGIRVAVAPSMDTYIHFPSVTTNYGSCDKLKIGTGPGTAIYRALMQFDLKAIPTGSSIEYASLTFSCVKVSGTADIAAYPVTSFWQEGESPCGGFATFNATWRYANDSGPGGRAWLAVNGGGDYLPASFTNSVHIASEGTYTFILNTAIVKAWVDYWPDNNGLIIIGGNEALADNSVTLGSGESNAFPTLRVRYK
jgi:hypothetical protein